MSTGSIKFLRFVMNDPHSPSFIKPHWCQSSISSLVVEDMARRHKCRLDDSPARVPGGALVSGDPSKLAAWGFDMGGIARVGRPYERVKFDWFYIECPSEDFDDLLIALRQIAREPRKLSNGLEYGKLHNPWTCLVLDSSMFAGLLASAQAMRDQVVERMEKEQQSKEKMLQKLSEQGFIYRQPIKKGQA